MASVFKRGGKRAKGNWIAAWIDHNGQRQTKSTRTTDKATAERVAKKWEADAALRREGVIDDAVDSISREARRAIESHLADYQKKLQAAGRTENHIEDTVRYIRKIVEQNGWETASDISADGVNHFAANLSEHRSARTVQAYLAAVKAFSKWLAREQKLPRDPLASVQKPNPKTGRQLERRMLLHDELPWLKAAALNGPKRYGMVGRERALLYDTAIQTGLRANELRSLTNGRLFLAGESPYITCKAGSTKNRKHAKQYIQSELASQLRDHVVKKAKAGPVFEMPHKYDVADMLRQDLNVARQAWLEAVKHDTDERDRRERSDFLLAKNHESEEIDFHALRHTCGAWLAAAGVHPKTVQTVMRHQSISLTMDTYGHLFQVK